jgi:hypothetical protein
VSLRMMVSVPEELPIVAISAAAGAIAPCQSVGVLQFPLVPAHVFVAICVSLGTIIATLAQK